MVKRSFFQHAFMKFVMMVRLRAKNSRVLETVARMIFSIVSAVPATDVRGRHPVFLPISICKPICSRFLIVRFDMFFNPQAILIIDVKIDVFFTVSNLQLSWFFGSRARCQRGRGEAGWARKVW
jgi:hypothetical protein